PLRRRGLRWAWTFIPHTAFRLDAFRSMQPYNRYTGLLLALIIVYALIKAFCHAFFAVHNRRCKKTLQSKGLKSPKKNLRNPAGTAEVAVKGGHGFGHIRRLIFCPLIERK